MSNIFQKSNEYKTLCEHANTMCKKPKYTYTFDDWIKIDHKYDRNSNCKVVLYKKNEEYAICFVGTDRKALIKDWKANFDMATKGTSDQIRKAKEFTKILIDDNNLDFYNTITIGHSEGGTEATHVGLDSNLRVVTFNAFGIDDSRLSNEIKKTPYVLNFRDPHDTVSKLKSNIGQTYITPSTQSLFMRTTLFGSIQAHQISAMGDCEQAIPVNEYKAKHPRFINNIKDIVITGKNIDTMPKEKLFAFYEPILMKELEHKRIHCEEDVKSGLVNVST